ncbi:MAG: helix-turn-helix transcriptional regulator [Bacteroidales bacterium]|nr:helix-turn-helix transcriptional regulator [Bacteroidales bacterium]
MKRIKRHLGLSVSRYNTFKAMISVSVMVFLICALLGIVFFTKISKELKANFKDFNEYIVSIVENQFQNSLNYSTSLILDPVNQKVITDNYDYDDLYDFSIRLNSFTKTNPIVDTIFIYYPELDIVICNNGVYSLKEYYLIEYGYNKRDSFNTWKNDIDKINSGFSYDSNQENIITYTRLSDSKDKQNNPNFRQIIIFKFNITGLTLEDSKSFVDELGFYIDGKLFLIKDNKTNHINSYLNNNSKLLMSNNETNYKDYFIYMNPFAFSNMYMISSMDVTTYNKSMMFFIIASIVTLFISFIVSILYSLKESKKIFKPFKDLAYKLSPNKYPKDSLQIINDKINSLLEEEDYKEERIKTLYYNLQCLFLKNLLKENLSEKYCNKLMNKNEIVFPYSYFYIFICDNKKVNDLLYTIKDELFIDINCQVYLSYQEKYLIGFINIEEEKNNQIKIIDFVRDVLSANDYDINQISFKLSDICLSLSTLYFGYLQCNYLLNKSNGVEFYEDSTKAIVQDLKDSFETNNLKLYHSCIDKVFSNNNYLPAYLLVNLITEIKQYSDDLNIDLDKNLEINKEIFYNIETIKKDVGSSKTVLVDKVNKIIDSSFRDENLGLYYISDILQVSNTYISTIYKEYCGIGIVQKINQKRIEYAKKLLLTSTMSVKEVAIASGFSSDISFIRVFKKIEALTPGKLRKKNQ